MDNKSFEIQVLERLTAIETTLKQQDYKAISERLNKVENTAISNEKRIDRMEDNTKWLWRTIAGSIITIVIGVIVAFIKVGG